MRKNPSQYTNSQIVMSGEIKMFVHVTFSNGSDPIIFRGREEYVKRRIKELKRHYNILNIEETNASGGGYFVFAENKREAEIRTLMEIMFQESELNGIPLF